MNRIARTKNAGKVRALPGGVCVLSIAIIMPATALMGQSSARNNIIALFHQWGAIQLLLVGLLIILFFAYKGFTPLIILFLALDAPMRAVAGMMMAIESTHTPPGKALTLPAFFVLAILFIFSLLQKKSKPKV